MKKKSNGKNGRGILWRILLIVAALIFAAVLELGKHTILGWILTAIVLLAFIIIRIWVLKGKGRPVRFLAWLALIAAFACILWISWPPYKAVPAVQGKSAGTTEIVHVEQGDHMLRASLSCILPKQMRRQSATGLT